MISSTCGKIVFPFVTVSINFPPCFVELTARLVIPCVFCWVCNAVYLSPRVLLSLQRSSLILRRVPSASRRKTQKTERDGPVFFAVDYSLEPVSMSEPMIIFWKIANRIMTGRTHMTAAAMTGPTSEV